MFDSIFDDLKYQFRKKHSTLGLLIIINVVVFVLLNLAYLIHRVSPLDIYSFLKENVFLMHTSWKVVLFRPWTIVTTFFSHEDFFHLFWNMLFLYYFGRIISDFINERRLLSLYILGGLVSSTMVLLMYNTIPYLAERHAYLLGASGAVYAISVAAATIAPNYEFNLIFLGPVKIKWIVLVYLFLSLIGTVGSNAGGNIAHLGGALLGYVYIRQLQKGKDWSKPLLFIFNLFSKRPSLKVSYKSKNSILNNPEYTPDQKEIDEILDKISRSGYESLSKEEKQKLFKASQK
jgi:membrane associated rhomboid family serine protease